MASKDDMEFEITRTIEMNTHLLKSAKIDRLKMYAWMEEMTLDYALLQKAYKFVHGPFLKRLKEMQKTWKIFAAQTWRNMELLSPSCPEIKKLKVLKSDLKYEWSQRPKPKRRR